MQFNNLNKNELSLLSIATTIVWIACLTVGIFGLFIPYPYASLAKIPEPVHAEIMKIEVVKLPPTPREVTLPQPQSEPPSPELLQPAPAAPRLAAPFQAPPLTAVAAPSPAIAFALPVEGLVQIVDGSHAGFTRPAHPATTAPSGTGPPGPGPAALPSVPPAKPAITHLTLGEGEGNQPIPDYPREAASKGEEGSVSIQFNVDPDGRVSSAQIVSPCRWPLLNQSALRTVRERWHFNPGPPRVFEVSIQFQLGQR